MQIYEINICQVMIFRLYTVYNKHEMIKIDNKSREKSQVLSQMLEKFKEFLTKARTGRNEFG